MDLETEAKPRSLNHKDPRVWFLTDLKDSTIQIANSTPVLV